MSCEFESHFLHEKMNNAEIAGHVQASGAKGNLYAVTANLRLNNDMAVNVMELLRSRKIELPVSTSEAEEILLHNKEYVNTQDEYEVLRMRGPYMESNLLIEEMVNLEYERMEQTGMIRLSETSSRRKDRYVSFAMGCYFATQLSRDIYNSDKVDYTQIPFQVSSLASFFRNAVGQNRR